MRATFDPYAGAPQLIFAFEAAVIGGAGSLWGTLIGGIVLGVAQSIGAQISPQGFFIAGHLAFLAVAVLAAVLRRFRPRLRRVFVRRPRMSARARHPGRTLDARIRGSRSTVAALAAIVCWRAGPLLFSANAIDQLTTLFIYVILAVMWNALVGYCGLVSIGQQAFFGLGAYFAVRLADAGVSVYPVAVHRRDDCRRRCRCRCPRSCCACKGGEFAIGMWVVAELAHLLVNLDTLVTARPARR